jgi:hypothetical protein
MKQITFIFLVIITQMVGALNAWALPNCVGSYSANNWDDCHGIYEWENGDVYIGGFKKGKKSGYGTYNYETGNRYNGEYKGGMIHGQGMFTYPDGTKYIGQYKNNQRNGHGTYIWSDGDIYVGEWQNENKHGQGAYFFSNGAKNIGTWENDNLNGYAITYFSDGSINKKGIFKENNFLISGTIPECIGQYDNTKWLNCIGTYKTTDGDTYVGGFKNGKFDGHGTYTFGVNTKWYGHKYIGDYKNNNRDGQGIYFYANGDKYIGEFKNNRFNGKGTFIYGLNTKSAGYKYIGEFKNGKRNGQGIMTYPDGQIYQGSWSNDERKGQGILTFLSSSKWEGQWDDSKLNGYAIKYFANGTIDKQGIFKDDEFLYAQTKTLVNCPSSGYFHNCFGLYEWENGDKYVGEWQNNNRNGQGTYTHVSGNKYIGEFKDNKRNGQGTFIWADGDKYVGEYKNNEQNGQGTYTWTNGDKYVGEYKNNEQNGQGTYTYSPRSEWAGHKYVGEFKNGLFNGQGTYTYADGSRDVGTWKNDKLNGYAIKYFANGSIKQEGIFKDDEWLYAEESSPNILNKGNQDNEVINASSGSGFAVSLDGYVITNNHVIEGCQEVILHTKEKDIKTRVISFDPQNDLALLKGDFQPKTVFALSNDRPELLQDIYVAGYPFGNAISSSIKVTKGIISSLTGIGNNFSNIQIDAALQSGNSGGPIIDDYGNVIAVAVSKLDAKYMLENFGSIPENTNFGIKSSVVKSMLDSNDVARPNANQSEISKTKLGKMISSGTYYISCWMTQAQIELLKSKKVLFEGLN